MRAQSVAEVVYFVSREDGKTKLSDGETVIGHIETVGVAFEINPVAGLMLGGMQTHPYPSKQELSKLSNCTQAGDVSQRFRELQPVAAPHPIPSPLRVRDSLGR
jgi:hypothetical protein